MAPDNGAVDRQCQTKRQKPPSFQSIKLTSETVMSPLCFSSGSIWRGCGGSTNQTRKSLPSFFSDQQTPWSITSFTYNGLVFIIRVHLSRRRRRRHGKTFSLSLLGEKDAERVGDEAANQKRSIFLSALPLYLLV